MAQLLTPQEAAKTLQVNVQTVRRWVRQGYLPAHRAGARGHIRINPDDIQALRNGG